ncbi:MAG: anaphase promoting complex subunit 5 [Chrysothrix sp. TS-e1954]|nr:MAG: anaphase promoting complex subunit 5 [Chrysothrix sp. TS-e1954]
MDSISRAAINLEGLEPPKQSIPLWDFSTPDSVEDCTDISDQDIGGYSQMSVSHVAATDQEPAHLWFRGHISNRLPAEDHKVQRTGYAAWRTIERPRSIMGRSFWDIEGFNYLALRMKSDGRKYNVNLQTDSIEEEDLHQHRLYTQRPGTWETVLIDWTEFVRTHRGTIVEPQSEMFRERLKTLGVGLTDRRAGPFEFKLSRMWATNGLSDKELEEAGSNGPAYIPRRLDHAPSICLLTLVVMYCDGYVPAKASVTVLSFVTDQLLPEAGRKQKRRVKSEQSASPSMEDFSSLLSPLKARTISQESTSIWHEFLKVSWAIADLDRLFNFFRSLPGLFQARQNILQNVLQEGQVAVPQIALSQKSLLGAFVRRSKLEFERLVFQDAVALWQSYSQFRAPARPHYLVAPAFEGLDPSTANDLHAAMNRGFDEEKSPRNVSSSYDMERMLSFQVEKMQKTGIRLPEELKSRLHSIAKPSTEASSLVHYIRFLDSWYAGDYQSSFDNLHRYYDYAMHNKGRSHYQYALLNMAILQADFGCYEDATAAMQETIATARENKDMPCLNFSLSWLYHFRTLYGEHTNDSSGTALVGKDRKSLEFLKSKAQENGMWSLVSSTLLNEAKLVLSTGESPYEALESSYQSSFLNLHHHVTSVEAAQLLTRSAIFGRLGITSASTINCNLVLSCYSTTSPAEEVMRARCRNAYTSALVGDQPAASKSIDIISTTTIHNLQLHQYAITYSNLLNLERSLHLMDLTQAENLHCSLKPMPPPDPDLKVQHRLLHIDYLVRISSFEEALKEVQQLADFCEQDQPDVYHRIRLLSTKAKIWRAVGRPQKGFSLAIRATAAAWRARVLPALWEATGVLAGVLSSLEEYDAAEKLVASVLYQAMETGDAELVGDLHSAATDAFMGQAGRKKDPEDRRPLLLRALASIREACESYEKIDELIKIRDTREKSIRILSILDDKAAVDIETKKLGDLNEKNQGLRELGM